MPGRDVLFKVMVAKEFTRHRGTGVIILYLYHRGTGYRKELERVWGGSDKAIDEALRWLLRMKLVTGKKSSEKPIGTVYSLTPIGLKIAAAVDRSMDDLVELYKTVSNHPFVLNPPGR